MEIVHTEELEMVFLSLQNEVVLTLSYHQDPLLLEENNNYIELLYKGNGVSELRTFN